VAVEAVADTMTLLPVQEAQEVVVLVLHKPLSQQAELLIPVVGVGVQVGADQETALVVPADMVS
jgi:hypothetical protein